MKVSEYIVDFLIRNQISHVFGYPGGMVTYLMDALQAREAEIQSYINYHEQAAAFAACGFAQTKNALGVAFATSGPGATNLITGICHAYFDSIPVLFLTGQVHTLEAKGNYAVRQKGFQETDIVSMVSGVTKYAVMVRHEEEIRYHLERAVHFALSGRPGPVLLDIPINIQRAEVEASSLRGFVPEDVSDGLICQNACRTILQAVQTAERPCILAGAGLRGSGMQSAFASLAAQLKVPVVSSMPAVVVLPNTPYSYGFIGAYGMRHANFILAKSDLILTLGSRMDLRQVGADTRQFAPGARLIRVDVDEAELSVPVKDNQECFACDLRQLLPLLVQNTQNYVPRHDNWISVCDEIKHLLDGLDAGPAHEIIKAISLLAPPDLPVTTDVGQNQVWVAQAFVPRGQRILFSAGHGAMGYSLPAAIGAQYASGKAVLCFGGDGGLQMNLQELQFVARERLPLKIIVLNNHALGMIRHFQEMYFDARYTQTKQGSGYAAPDFQAIAQAFQIPYTKLSTPAEVHRLEPWLHDNNPVFIEVALPDDTYVFPKQRFGQPIQDQEPFLDRDVYRYILEL